MTVYYLWVFARSIKDYNLNFSRQRKDSRDPAYKEGIHAFPEGFMMLAGDPTLRSYTDTPEQKAISYNCLGTNAPETKGFPKIKCPNGLRARMSIIQIALQFGCC